MAVQDGISEAQALKLLELARIANKMPNVKTVDKDIRSKPGRALLLGLKNSRTAIIKPFNHGGKEEEADLSTVRFWKGGCDFDISEAKAIGLLSMQPKTTTATLLQATGNAIVSMQTNYVIFSRKMKGVWRGDKRRWTNEIRRASKWSDRDRPHALQALGKINKVPMQDDAIVMSYQEAEMALLDVLTAPAPAAPTSTIVPVAPPVNAGSFTMSDAPAKPSLFPSLVAAARPLPQATTLNNTDGDDFLDLEALLNPNETQLRLAEAERKRAAEEYMGFKKQTAAALEKLKQFNEQVVRLGGRSVMKSAEPPQEGKKKKKRVFVRNKIQKILLASSRLDGDSIHERVCVELPGLEKLKTQQALSAMKNEGLAERDDNGGWALTQKGRTAEMIGSEN